MNEQYQNYNENPDQRMVPHNNNPNINFNNSTFNNDVQTTDKWRHNGQHYYNHNCHTVMPHFNPTAPPFLLEQHFYGLLAPLRSAAHTTAHSLSAAASSLSTPAANMVADPPKITNFAAGIAPCIVGWDSMVPQGYEGTPYYLQLIPTAMPLMPTTKDFYFNYFRMHKFC
uniref:Uncharacterized protein n=1 Tax=Romanomermis culicivorax TaxID=13658 RepID=A0A915HXD1_ROMCU